MSKFRYLFLVLLAGCSFTMFERDYRFATKPLPAPHLVPAQPGWFYVLSKPGFPDLLVGPYPWQNDAGNGIAICRDWLGSMKCTHGPQCLPRPGPGSCACLPSCIPGIAAAIGATTSGDCSQMPDAGLKRGYYYVDQALVPHGPYTKQQCMNLDFAPAPRRSYCFGVGKIGNTEGSIGGP